MSIGIECLLTDDAEAARALARRLDDLNRERRDIQAEMQDGALAHLESVDPGDAFGLALYDPAWHQGVIGILAARIRERFHRPVIAFARGQGDELKGSGRSIPTLHLRDALDLLDKQHPGMIVRFGGHAAAAGLSIRAPDFDAFRTEFDVLLRKLIGPADLQLRIETDGPLFAPELNLPLARRLHELVWGQGFPAPRFRGRFRVQSRRTLSGGHQRLWLQLLQLGGHAVEGVVFGEENPLPDSFDAVYRLDVNEYNGLTSLQLVIEHWEPAG
jgi:single-stranded-DNA-specific exonuclease